MCTGRDRSGVCDFLSRGTHVYTPGDIMYKNIEWFSIYDNGLSDTWYIENEIALNALCAVVILLLGMNIICVCYGWIKKKTKISTI